MGAAIDRTAAGWSRLGVLSVWTLAAGCALPEATPGSGPAADDTEFSDAGVDSLAEGDETEGSSDGDGSGEHGSRGWTGAESDGGASSDTDAVDVCGDGRVGADEECDDGNEEDGDACLSSCVHAVCGDGVVFEGVEACDDGNPVDGDACTNDCTAAACGDGIVHLGVEACDDGNLDDDDECPADCGTSHCLDGVISGDESDVDCGGAACGSCDDGAGCEQPTDCASGSCAEGFCVRPRHCRDVRDLGLAPADQDGLFLVDPDGVEGPHDLRMAWCEHSYAGGGWTAVFNYPQPPPGQIPSLLFHAATSSVVPLAAVSPWSASAALHTAELELADMHEVVYGWAPAPEADVARSGTISSWDGLATYCPLTEGACAGDWQEVALVEPGALEVAVAPADTAATLHVGLVDADGRTLWGYDPDDAPDTDSAWGNWATDAPCCGPANDATIDTPGWRYVILVR